MVKEEEIKWGVFMQDMWRFMRFSFFKLNNFYLEYDIEYGFIITY